LKSSPIATMAAVTTANTVTTIITITVETEAAATTLRVTVDRTITVVHRARATSTPRSSRQNRAAEATTEATGPITSDKRPTGAWYCRPVTAPMATSQCSTRTTTTTMATIALASSTRHAALAVCQAPHPTRPHRPRPPIRMTRTWTISAATRSSQFIQSTAAEWRMEAASSTREVWVGLSLATKLHRLLVGVEVGEAEMPRPT
jgi:hypothetical protein